MNPAEQIEALQEEVRYLKDILTLAQWTPRPEWKLSYSEARVLGALVRSQSLPREKLIRTLYWDKDEPENAYNVLKVLMCRLRKRLKPFGIEIRTTHGLGYSLAPDAVRSLCAPSGAAR